MKQPCFSFYILQLCKHRVPRAPCMPSAKLRQFECDKQLNNGMQHLSVCACNYLRASCITLNLYELSIVIAISLTICFEYLDRIEEV